MIGTPSEDTPTGAAAVAAAKINAMLAAQGKLVNNKNAILVSWLSGCALFGMSCQLTIDLLTGVCVRESV